MPEPIISTSDSIAIPTQLGTLPRPTRAARRAARRARRNDPVIKARRQAALARRMEAATIRFEATGDWAAFNMIERGAR